MGRQDAMTPQPTPVRWTDLPVARRRRLVVQIRSDGMVAALPRRHREVPQLWCSTPRRERTADDGYDDWGGPGQERVPAPWRLDDGACEVPQEGDPAAVPAVHGG